MTTPLPELAETSHQPAILAETPVASSLEWDLRPQADPAALWALLAALDVEGMVIGLGAPVLDAVRATVPGYRAFARLSRGRYTMPATPHALWTLVLGDSPSAVFERCEQLKPRLGEHLALVQATNLFSYRQGRDLTGYRDGSANPKGAAAQLAAFVNEGQALPEGSSFALVQRWLHFRDRFQSLPRASRDHVVGRDIESDEELDSAPPAAHIRRTVQESFTPEGFIYRRSMPWGDGRRHGLQFIAFMSDLGKVERMLNRMIGAEDHIADAILGHSQAETGAFYFTPPVRAGQLLLPPAEGPRQAIPIAVDGIQAAQAQGLKLTVDVSRCIHSRNCVLARPDVFVPNVQGPWLHPELASAQELRELAHNCPSGAITYEPLDGSEPESPPRRAVIRLRENGPLALHGDFRVAGVPERRATLCRCGQSRRKPYCDGSHRAAGFAASGEATAADAVPPVMPNSATRAAVTIQPIADGPLVVQGAVDIVGGSGQTIGSAWGPTLCRCGQSANKPYCDGSHARVGFCATE